MVELSKNPIAIEKHWKKIGEKIYKTSIKNKKLRKYQTRYFEKLVQYGYKK